MSTTQSHAERAAEEIHRNLGLDAYFLGLSEEIKAGIRADLTAIIARACQASVEEYRAALEGILTYYDNQHGSRNSEESGVRAKARSALTRHRDRAQNGGGL